MLNSFNSPCVDEYNIIETAFTKYVKIHAKLGDGTTRSEQLEFVSASRRKLDLETIIAGFYFEEFYLKKK